MVQLIQEAYFMKRLLFAVVSIQFFALMTAKSFQILDVAPHGPDSIMFDVPADKISNVRV